MEVAHSAWLDDIGSGGKSIGWGEGVRGSRKLVLVLGGGGVDDGVTVEFKRTAVSEGPIVYVIEECMLVETKSRCISGVLLPDRLEGTDLRTGRDASYRTLTLRFIKGRGTVGKELYRRILGVSITFSIEVKDRRSNKYLKKSDVSLKLF
jgi:hypothetical protein